MLLCCKLKQKMCRGDILLFKLIKIKIAITSPRKTSEAQSAAIVKIDRSCSGMYSCFFVFSFKVKSSIHSKSEQTARGKF